MLRYFPLLFGKEFLIIGKDKNHATRMIDLMKDLNIPNRVIIDSEIYNLLLGGACASIDYESIKKILCQKRNWSIQFLKSS